MFLLPLSIFAMVGFAVYAVMRHRAQPATGTDSGPRQPGAPRPSAGFWPTTIEGKAGVGAFAANFLLMALVNVIQVYLLGPAVLLAALVLTGRARYTKDDHSTTVLIAFVVCALAALAGALFLVGEIFIGHD